MGDTKFAYFTANNVVSNLLRREATDNPIYTGRSTDRRPEHRPSRRTCPPTTCGSSTPRSSAAWPTRSTARPGYTVSDMAVQIQTEREADRDAWDMWGRRKTVPVVQEPGAAIRITGS
jgi:hypothetical protein